jgi:FkbM family methyltransferase
MTTSSAARQAQDSKPEFVTGMFKHPGGTLRFELFNNDVCIRISEEILGGKTYPEVPFVTNVRTIIDVGANIGAAAAFLATTYPAATVYALEPATAAFALLQRNVETLSQVRIFHHGLFSDEKSLALYPGRNDSVESSIFPSNRTNDAGETITLRAVSAFLAEENLDQIDILKLDTEGCEVPILRALRPQIAGMKLIYVEYHSDRDRRLIDELLAATHVLWRGHCALAHRGEFCYLRRDLLPPESEIHTCEILLPLDEAE